MPCYCVLQVRQQFHPENMRAEREKLDKFLKDESEDEAESEGSQDEDESEGSQDEAE